MRAATVLNGRSPRQVFNVCVSIFILRLRFPTACALYARHLRLVKYNWTNNFIYLDVASVVDLGVFKFNESLQKVDTDSTEHTHTLKGERTMKHSAIRKVAAGRRPPCANPSPPVAFPGAHFGTYIKALRKRAHLSQDELSRIAGVSKSYISILERGGGASLDGSPTRPSLKVVDRLSSALSQPVGEMRARAGYQSEEPKVSGFARSRFRRLFFKYQKLSSEHQAEVDQMLKHVEEAMNNRLPDESSVIQAFDGGHNLWKK